MMELICAWVFCSLFGSVLRPIYYSVEGESSTIQFGTGHQLRFMKKHQIKILKKELVLIASLMFEQLLLSVARVE